MKTVLSHLLGSSRKTSLMGYAQFLIAFSIEMFGKGETNFKVIAASAVMALLARKSADGDKVKKLADQIDLLKSRH